MLQVFDAENNQADIIDIDATFSKLSIALNDQIKNIIKAVDLGEMVDDTTFSDRFGVRLYLSELSTGCKAAICVALMPDKIVDLQECGLNARDAIFNYCEDGKILLHDFGVTIIDAHTRKSPIEYAGKLFTIDSFNEEVL
jgi:hypothetical protein